MKRWLSWLLTAAMLLCFAAPVLAAEVDVYNLNVMNPYGLPQDYSAYPVKGEPTITIWFPIDPWFAQAVKNFNDIAIMPVISKLTGINVDWIHPAAGMADEQFNLMIAGDNLPDLIVTANRYPGKVIAGVADGVYQDLTDLIPQYMPTTRSSACPMMTASARP